MFTRPKRSPVLVYRNPSATLSVWPDGDNWTLAVGEQDGAEVTFRFTDRASAEGAAKHLAYRRLTGVVLAGMGWHALVDAVNDADPAEAAAKAVDVELSSRGLPDWVAERRTGPIGRVGDKRRALEGRVTDTPSARVAAQRRAAKEFHATIATSAVDEWRAKAPLAERLREDDGPGIAELFVRTLIGNPELRAELLDVLAELDGEPTRADNLETVLLAHRPA